MLVFCWIWIKIVGWIRTKNIDVLTLLGLFDYKYHCCHIDWYILVNIIVVITLLVLICLGKKLCCCWVTFRPSRQWLLPAPEWVGKNKKRLEFPEMVRKLIWKCFNISPPPKPLSSSVDGGLSGGSSVRRPESESLHRQMSWWCSRCYIGPSPSEFLKNAIPRWTKTFTFQTFDI